MKCALLCREKVMVKPRIEIVFDYDIVTSFCTVAFSIVAIPVWCYLHIARPVKMQ